MSVERANAKVLNSVVERIRRRGFPKVVKEPQLVEKLSLDDLDLLADLHRLVTSEHRLCSAVPNDGIDHRLSQIRLVARRRFQLAICRPELIKLAVVQRNATYFGSIPSAKHGWVYCELPDGSLVKWESGK